MIISYHPGPFFSKFISKILLMVMINFLILRDSKQLLTMTKSGDKSCLKIIQINPGQDNDDVSERSVPIIYGKIGDLRVNAETR